jgi:hypothetical protein
MTKLAWGQVCSRLKDSKILAAAQREDEAEAEAEENEILNDIQHAPSPIARHDSRGSLVSESGSTVEQFSQATATWKTERVNIVGYRCNVSLQCMW